MYSDAPYLLRRICSRAFNISRCFRLASLSNGMLMIIRHVKIDAQGLQRISQRGDGPIANTSDAVLPPVYLDDTRKDALSGFCI